MGVVRFGVSLPRDIAHQFDDAIKKEGYETRSKAIYDLIKKYITQSKWQHGEKIAGIISILYDHHEKDAVNTLLEIQHEYHDIIISSQHIHLDHDNCFEVIIVKGKSNEVEGLYRRLKTLKNIKDTSLTVADIS
ncbi:nickel-responsive transcriptional regulator NikR [Deferribacter autotrophicus]|uniref:Putative nickel-responsive regulator n=1 Tax=Deferribacter autotrophicus TaxID=500465 RepID=A0A5A8F4N7_9BACT|nr:nickel-responsive transcriptional regulator NikR [Deferribacter autotrophicus]KAA0258561.1 nickel-responsive transcriptional regulator NikR [Deferribacter autotrophicus]